MQSLTKPPGLHQNVLTAGCSPKTNQQINNFQPLTMNIKAKVFEIIDGDDQPSTRLNRIVEMVIMTLIIISVVSIILESFESLYGPFRGYFWISELVIVIIFSLEYLLRLWTADLKYPEKSKLGARLRFIFSGMGIIDLLAIIPFYLPFLVSLDLRMMRMLRITRLLRILKLKRYSRAMNIVSAVVYEKRSELSLTISVTFLLLLMSSTIMYYLEHDVQPDAFPDIITTLWWAVATLTTVGYGDVYPVTGWGRLISGIIALLGIGVVALPTGIISASFIDELEKDKEEAAKNKEAKSPQKPFRYCPHCGEKLEES